MTSETAGPVIAGLAVGIALIVVFSASIKPSFTMSDDEVLQKVRNLPEVQALRDRYTPLEGIGRDGTMTYVYYQIGRTWYADNYSKPSDFDERKELRLTVKVDPFGRTEVLYECLGRLSTSGIANIELVKTTECIERP